MPQQLQEEITTIFVVGFPQDMQEREFQNMFIFSPGFEAATLKIPAKDEIDSAGHKKQIVSNVFTSSCHLKLLISFDENIFRWLHEIICYLPSLK
jgi:hypothetical protein